MYEGPGRKGDAAVHGTSLHFRVREESQCRLMPGRHTRSPRPPIAPMAAAAPRVPEPGGRRGGGAGSAAGAAGGGLHLLLRRENAKVAAAAFSFPLPAVKGCSMPCPLLAPLLTLPFRASLSKSRPLPRALRGFAGGDGPHPAVVKQEADKGQRKVAREQSGFSIHVRNQEQELAVISGPCLW